MTKNEKIADDIFKADEAVKEVFVCDDGTAFVSKNMADLHANTNASGKKLKVETFTRPGKDEAAADAKAAAEAKIAEAAAKKQAEAEAKKQAEAEAKAKAEAIKKTSKSNGSPEIR
jgi:colicin import membrane protein